MKDCSVEREPGRFGHVTNVQRGFRQSDYCPHVEASLTVITPDAARNDCGEETPLSCPGYVTVFIVALRTHCCLLWPFKDSLLATYLQQGTCDQTSRLYST